MTTATRPFGLGLPEELRRDPAPRRRAAHRRRRRRPCSNYFRADRRRVAEANAGGLAESQQPLPIDPKLKELRDALAMAEPAGPARPELAQLRHDVEMSIAAARRPPAHGGPGRRLGADQQPGVPVQSLIEGPIAFHPSESHEQGETRDDHRSRTARQRPVRPPPRDDPPRPAARRRLGHARPVARLDAPAPGRLGRARPAAGRRPGWGKAKSIIMVYLQGGPEPPRPLGPQGQRARQRPERLQADRHQGCPASQFTEILPEARRRSTTSSR